MAHRLGMGLIIPSMVGSGGRFAVLEKPTKDWDCVTADSIPLVVNGKVRREEEEEEGYLSPVAWPHLAPHRDTATDHTDAKALPPLLLLLLLPPPVRR